ncbi:MAG: hypothetical protein ACR2JG_04870 [Geodermatophilaceae bacterium]
MDAFWGALGQFVLSPGFGGLAALAAAATALRAALKRLVADREVARQDRWWETLGWIYDRALHENTDQRLPEGLALQLFQRLAREAKTPLEEETAEGLVLGLFSEGEGEPSDDQ